MWAGLFVPVPPCTASPISCNNTDGPHAQVPARHARMKGSPPGVPAISPVAAGADGGGRRGGEQCYHGERQQRQVPASHEGERGVVVRMMRSIGRGVQWGTARVKASTVGDRRPQRREAGAAASSPLAALAWWPTSCSTRAANAEQEGTRSRKPGARRVDREKGVSGALSGATGDRVLAERCVGSAEIAQLLRACCAAPPLEHEPLGS